MNEERTCTKCEKQPCLSMGGSLCAECNRESVDQMHFVHFPPATLAQWSGLFDTANERGEYKFQRRDKKLKEFSPGDWATRLSLVVSYSVARRLHRKQLAKNAPFWLRVAILAPAPQSMLAFVLGALAYRFYLSWFVL